MRNLILSTLAACVLLAACASNPMPVPSANYVGAWRLEAIGDRPVVGPRLPSLTLDTHGHANGNGGCNSFGGQYTARGATLTFSRMISTMMACAGPNGEDISTQEHAMLSILNGDVRASVAGDAMALTAIDGRTLHFRRGPLGS
ncbi:MAG: META domain-containing protein [Terricaulis sp.]